MLDKIRRDTTKTELRPEILPFEVPDESENVEWEVNNMSGQKNQ